MNYYITELLQLDFLTKYCYINEKIGELRSNLISVFSQAGIQSIPISQQEAIGNEKTTGLIERYLTLNFREGEPMLGGIDFRDRLRVMDRFVEILSLSDFSHLPSEISPSAKHPQTGLPVSLVYPVTYNLPFTHITNQFIYVPGQQEVKSILENSYKKIYSLSRFSTENKINSGLIENFLDTVVLPKLTIPDKRILRIEMLEKALGNTGRKLALEIQNKDILQANKINY